MRNKKLEIPLGNRKIVAEICDVDVSEIPVELSVFIEDEDGSVLQDICLVRPHCKSDRIEDNRVDCIVWSDENNEDYTHKHVIGVYEESREEQL